MRVSAIAILMMCQAGGIMAAERLAPDMLGNALSPPIPEQPMNIPKLRHILFDDECAGWQAAGKRFTSGPEVTDYLQRRRVAEARVTDNEYLNKVFWPVMRDCVFSGYWGSKLDWTAISD